jgi:hypothetical protein
MGCALCKDIKKPLKFSKEIKTAAPIREYYPRQNIYVKIHNSKFSRKLKNIKSGLGTIQELDLEHEETSFVDY